MDKAQNFLTAPRKGKERRLAATVLVMLMMMLMLIVFIL